MVFHKGAERAKLKPSQLDAQGSVFDDTGVVEMLSTRSIILRGREGKRLKDKINMQRDHSEKHIIPKEQKAKPHPHASIGCTPDHL